MFLFSQSLLLITEGRQKQFSDPNEPPPAHISSAIKGRGIEISVIGFGAVDVVELFAYVSYPDALLIIKRFFTTVHNKFGHQRTASWPG